MTEFKTADGTVTWIKRKHEMRKTYGSHVMVMSGTGKKTMVKVA